MAKLFSLKRKPKSQKDISTHITDDFMKESALLENLIKEVVNANQQVKASHQKRVEDAEEKLNILNAEINKLKKDIDQETETETINYDQLFKTKKELFNHFETIQHSILSLYNQVPTQQAYQSVKDALKKALHDQISPTTRNLIQVLNASMHHLENFTNAHIEESASLEATLDIDLATFEDASLDKINTFDKFLTSLKSSILSTLKERTHYFLDDNQEVSYEEKIKKSYEDQIKAIEKEQNQLEKTYKKDIKAIEDSIVDYKNETRSALEEKYGKPTSTKSDEDEQVKALKLAIIRAEKLDHHEDLEKLMLRYQKLTGNTNQNKLENKINRLLSQRVHKYSKTLETQKLQRKETYLNEAYALRLQKDLESLKYNTSTILFKLEDDQNELTNDKEVTRILIEQLNHTLDELKTFLLDLLTLVFDYQKNIIRFEHQSISLENKRLGLYDTFKKTIKKQEAQWLINIQASLYDLKRVKAHYDYQSLYTLQSLKQFHALNKIDKQKIMHIHSADINVLKEKQKAEKERLYYESFIKVAEKEYELQTLKLRSLYDHEISLTQAQAERLDANLSINKKMVETTVERQVNFANQQVKYAESEYDLRLKHIEHTLNQELDYTNRKELEASAQYDQQIKALKHAYNQKLEALNYKRSLFEDSKSLKKLDEQVLQIQQQLEQELEAIKTKKEKDPVIKRYQKQIELAKNRAGVAKQDAKDIKDRTIDSFKDLKEQSEVKLQSIQDAQSEQKLLPHINDTTKELAKKRLEEGVNEAKSFLTDKIEAPLNALKAIDERISTIKKDETFQEKIEHLNQQINQINEAFEDKIKSLETQRSSTLEAIDHEAKLFEEKAQKAIDQTKFEDLIKLSEQNQKHIDQTYQEKEKLIDKKRDEQQTIIENRFKEHQLRIQESKTIIDEAFKETLNAYNKYLNKATKATKAEQATIKKQNQETLKKVITDAKKNKTI